MKLLFIYALLAISLWGFAETPDDFERYVEAVRQESKVPGMAVTIVKGDRIEFAKGFGVAHIDQPEKVNADTIFQLASTTKTFTAAGIAVQVDKGKIGWDDEVDGHLPEFLLKDPYPSRYTTSRDLLAHRTGLPAFRGDLLGVLGISRQEILRRIRYIEPGSSFREKAQYSNVGFFVAGELLARLTGKTFEESIKETLLKPLKMERSGFSDLLSDPNVAMTHALFDGKVKAIPRDKQDKFNAAGGMVSTAQDMGRWMVMQLNGGAFEGREILKPETVKAMHLPSIVAEVTFTELPPIDENSGFSFGMGWDCYHYNGKMIVEKAGALDGVRSVVTLIPELHVGISVLANLNLTVAPEIIRAKFLEKHLGGNGSDMAKLISEREKQLADLMKPPEKPRGVLPVAHPLNHYTGTFHNELYGSIVVRQEGERLAFDAGPAHWKGRLTPWGNDTFLLQWPLIDSGHEYVTFTFGPEGKPTLITTETLGSFVLED